VPPVVNGTTAVTVEGLAHAVPLHAVSVYVVVSGIVPVFAGSVSVTGLHARPFLVQVIGPVAERPADTPTVTGPPALVSDDGEIVATQPVGAPGVIGVAGIGTQVNVRLPGLPPTVKSLQFGADTVIVACANTGLVFAPKSGATTSTRAANLRRDALIIADTFTVKIVDTSSNG